MTKPFTLQNIKNSPVAALNQHLWNNVSEKENKSKYGNKKATLDGYVFDSKKECNRYQVLKIRLAAGEIADLELQVPYQLTACKYYADFRYLENGEVVVEDVKSPATRKLTPYRMKFRMMQELYGIIIREV